GVCSYDLGGGIRREEGSQVYGEVVELGVGGPWAFAPVATWGGFDHDMFSGWFRLMGTGLRISLLLLATLAISIIGIPLLLLVPFALVALFLGILMGFAGVARRLGRWAVGEDRSAMLATTGGVVLVVAAAIVARLLWLVPGPIWPIA